MDKHIGRKVKGYFTVEASMIIPLVIFLIAFLFYLSFFLYNRCIFSQDIYILSFRGSIRCGEEEGEITRYMEETWEEQFAAKNIGINGLQKDIQISSTKVKAEVEGSMKTSFTGSLGIKNQWFFAAAGEAERICPTECMRKMRLVKKAGEEMQNEKMQNEK